jgi:hypothetical protein
VRKEIEQKNIEELEVCADMLLEERWVGNEIACVETAHRIKKAISYIRYLEGMIMLKDGDMFEPEILDKID